MEAEARLRAYILLGRDSLGADAGGEMGDEMGEIPSPCPKFDRVARTGVLVVVDARERWPNSEVALEAERCVIVLFRFGRNVADPPDSSDSDSSESESSSEVLSL